MKNNANFFVLITIMFNYSYNNNCRLRPADFDLPPESVICARRETGDTNDTGEWQIKIQGSQMTTMPE